MTRRAQISAGFAGFFLLLITLWPFLVFPKNVIRGVLNLFDSTVSFAQRAAGILTTVFVMVLFAFGIGLLVVALRKPAGNEQAIHISGSPDDLPGLKPGEQLLLRIMLLSFILGVINIVSLFGSCIITFSVFDCSPDSPYQIFIEVPAVIVFTVFVFCLLLYFLCQIMRKIFLVKSIWELVLLYCMTFIWLAALYTPIPYIFGDELYNVEIFSLAWPVLAATNILALLVVKQGIHIIKINGDI